MNLIDAIYQILGKLSGIGTEKVLPLQTECYAWLKEHKDSDNFIAKLYFAHGETWYVKTVVLVLYVVILRESENNTYDHDYGRD